MGEVHQCECSFKITRSEPVLVQAETEKSSDEFYFLSCLDQLPILIETVYVFKPDDDKKSTEDVGRVIREALAKVLLHFYPLAGSLTVSNDGKLIVKCTNKGVPFVEAVADYGIDVLGDLRYTNTSMLMELVYTDPAAANNNIIPEMPLLTVQVTRFKCGGFVMGMIINHCMTDGISAMEFVNTWSEIARGISPTILPAMDRSILKARQPPMISYAHSQYVEIEDISNISAQYEGAGQMVYKSFEFDREKLSRLKKIIMEDGSIKHCSTFVALTALVWRARSKILNMKENQQTKLLFAVDGRSKLTKPPLPKGYFGNGAVLTYCLCNAGELAEKPLSYAVKMVQDAIDMVNEEFILSTIDCIEVNKGIVPYSATLLVSSWTKLAFNTTDFGWGQPTQTGCVTSPKKEIALFLSGGGKGKAGTTIVLALPVNSVESFQELMDI